MGLVARRPERCLLYNPLLHLTRRTKVSICAAFPLGQLDASTNTLAALQFQTQLLRVQERFQYFLRHSYPPKQQRTILHHPPPTRHSSGRSKRETATKRLVTKCLCLLVSQSSSACTHSMMCLLQDGRNLPPSISSKAGGNGLKPQTSLASNPQHVRGRCVTSSLCPNFGICMLYH